jgi:hypothetical protein
MAKAPEPDFRNVLNALLKVFYEQGGAVLMIQEHNLKKVPVSYEQLYAGVRALIDDGHLEDVAPGYSSFPVGAITGQGRIFHEQGGYRDETTKVDRMIYWGKNHPIISIVVFLFILASSTTGIIGVILQLIELFKT